MEMDDVVVVVGIIIVNFEVLEFWKKVNGGRNESLGIVGVECYEKIILEVKEIKVFGLGVDVLGVVKYIVFESGDRKNVEGGVFG